MNTTTDATTGAPRNETTNAVCSVCKWTNTGLLNLGVFGTPRWVCHSCCATLASERDSFRDEAKRLRDLLARALPVLKHRAVDGSGEAEALVGEVQGALEGGATRREAREQFERWAKEGDADCCGLPGHGPLGAPECPEHSKAARPRVTQHWGDCTYYASLANRSPTDGICTCGYGWTVFADSGGVDQSQLYSRERIVAMCVKGYPLRSRPDDSGAWASDADHDGLEAMSREWRAKVERLKAALEKLAGYARTVRLDRERIFDGTPMCLQTTDWCLGLVDYANEASALIAPPGAPTQDDSELAKLRAENEKLRTLFGETLRLPSERDVLASQCEALRADVARLREALERVADVHPWQSSASQAGQMSAIARDALAATAHNTGTLRVAASGKERAS